MKRLHGLRQPQAVDQRLAGHQHMPVLKHAARHHRLVHDRADAHGHVDAVLDEVYATLGGIDMQLDVRVALLEQRQ